MYRSDWHEPRSTPLRQQAVRRHYLQRPVHQGTVARIQQKLRKRLASLFAFGVRDRRTTLGVGTALAVALVGMVILPGFASVNAPTPVATQLTLPLDLPPLSDTLESEASVSALESDLYLAGDNDAGWQVVTVRRNETLGNIFSRLGLSASLMHKLLDANEHVRSLVQIHPGDQIAFRIPADGVLTGLQFDRSETQRILIEVDGDAINERIIDRPLERRLQYGSAVISHSLFGAGDAAGLSDLTVMKLAEVFNFDIDFAQDLRKGDSFSVIYEAVYRDGVRLRDGDIVAAVFVNQGKRYEAYRHVDASGRSDYYAADGRSLRKAFIRTPVEFSRISSRFSTARKHPILGRVRAHKGVDYAAPTGTPIRAAGSGTVTFVGNRSGWGKTIEIQHGKTITTLYAHMSRFGKGMARGTKVQQGEVIGYVGMTGLATGPHLHYEFRVNGVHRDPLSVDLPKGDPLAGSELAAFQKAREGYQVALATVSEQIAQR
jgi:murein DD-endopeptidase MepM/ murein hydrolase activator NlpD